MAEVNLDRELRKTRPDYVVYRPKRADGSTHDTGNEHFLVFDGPDGSLMAVWTQSTHEGQPDQRVVFARSDDEGRTWTQPRVLMGPEPPARAHMRSWQFPMVSRSGRIYVLCSGHIGVNDVFAHTTGLMVGMHSDDAGQTWSAEETVPMPRSIYDHPDPAVPANWIVWQKPARLSEDKYFAGFTRWVSTAVRHPPPIESWMYHESVVEFMRVENVDDEPAVKDLEIRWSLPNEAALRVGVPGHPEVSVVQEPSVVRLPDSRLFCTLRTVTGRPYWTLSADGGLTWLAPAAMRYVDGGPELLHPLSPCPIYDLGGGRYMFLYHAHDGHLDYWGPLDGTHHRRPIMVSLGAFRPGAEQPLWFSPPKMLFDNGGVPLGYGSGRADLAMYASFTIRHGRRVLWYPDRKFFLLGREITDDWLSDLFVAPARETAPR